MKPRLFPALLGLLLLATGCSTVATLQPLGEDPVALPEEAWAGTWIHKDGAVTVRVVNPAQGLLEVGWVEESGGRLMTESHTVQLRRSAGWTFGNLEAEGEPGRYLWARVEKEGNQIIVWRPDPGKFKRLVEEGRLPGSVTEDDDVVLQPLTAEQVELLTSEREGVLLEWDDPVIFTRLVP